MELEKKHNKKESIAPGSLFQNWYQTYSISKYQKTGVSFILNEGIINV